MTALHEVREYGHDADTRTGVVAARFMTQSVSCGRFGLWISSETSTVSTHSSGVRLGMQFW